MCEMDAKCASSTIRLATARTLTRAPRAIPLSNPLPSSLMSYGTRLPQSRAGASGRSRNTDTIPSDTSSWNKGDALAFIEVCGSGSLTRPKVAFWIRHSEPPVQELSFPPWAQSMPPCAGAFPPPDEQQDTTELKRPFQDSS